VRSPAREYHVLMNYEVVERVLRTSVRAAGFDFTSQPVDRGERIDFAIWPLPQVGLLRTQGARPLFAADPSPRLRDFENEQQVKECAGHGLRLARRAAERDAVA
jgi:hypothetical protein